MTDTRQAAARNKAPMCFLPECNKQGTDTAEVDAGGGVKVDVPICPDHKASLAEAHEAVAGKGAGMCHVCDQPVGLLEQQQLIGANISKGDKVVVSWWQHGDTEIEAPTFCHEGCRCKDREHVGMIRRSTTVEVGMP